MKKFEKLKAENKKRKIKGKRITKSSSSSEVGDSSSGEEVSNKGRKGRNKCDKTYKKKFYCEVHIGQEWESNDENSNSDSDGVTTVAIKVTSS
jgi:hypothetical protein